MNTVRSSLNLACSSSRVMQKQLVALHTKFSVPQSITLRSPSRGELPLNTKEDEVAFPLVTLDCEVRLPLAPFMRRFLNEAPLHLLLMSPTI